MSLRIPRVVSTDGDFPIKDCSKTSLASGTVTEIFSGRKPVRPTTMQFRTAICSLLKRDDVVFPEVLSTE